MRKFRLNVAEVGVLSVGKGGKEEIALTSAGAGGLVRDGDSDRVMLGVVVEETDLSMEPAKKRKGGGRRDVNGPVGERGGGSNGSEGGKIRLNESGVEELRLGGAEFGNGGLQ